ncbi:hypothetical protein MANES_16G047550v8 [Manihot esculenta]|uniref:Uncharacterized protein n=1 Tax=Manihot esculenta TaxID=3983 RepID=A0ACB7G5Q9_MANES|nr:hypothetical protein MANES_16G047550v8 [Manihot esculenta]
MWIRKTDKEVRWTSKLNPEKADRRDKNKYCHFHKDHKHTTEECRQLKDEIERLIRDSTLRNFTRKDREKRRPELEIRTLKNTTDSEPMGLYCDCRCPNDGKGKNKRVAEDEIKLKPADKVMRFFHTDPLVISIHLNTYDVRQVLINTGLNKNNLAKISYSLVGLGDKTVAVLGTINLSLVLGDDKYKQKLYAEFTVVDIPLAYNVILGCPVLNCHCIVIK